jgi:hypothetical protein
MDRDTYRNGLHCVVMPIFIFHFTKER